MQKILTVVIPAYNMEKYLQRCCESVLVKDRLLREQLEVIVVNDGSQDRTLDIAKHFAVIAPETFVVVDKPNGNYGSCVNVGINLAKGVYFRVLDADDYLDVEVFEAYLRFLLHFNNDARPDLVVSDYVHITPQGQIVETHIYNFAIDFGFSLADIPMGVVMQQYALTYKLQLLQRIGYFQSEGISYTDTEYSIEPLVAVKNVVYFNKILAYYQVGRDGQTMNATTYARNFWMMVKIGCNVISRHSTMMKYAVPEAVGYYEHRVKWLIRECYYTGIFGHKNIAVSVDLLPLDSLLVIHVPEIWRWTEELKFPFPLFPIRYVQAWRKGQKVRLIVARLIRRASRALLWKSNIFGR